MPLNNETLANCSKFISVAVLSCLLMTGGLWLYHNRQDIVEGVRSPNKQSGNCFTRWAGVDATRLKDDYTKNIMSEHVTQLPTKFEIGPEMIQQLHQSYTWNPDDR